MSDEMIQCGRGHTGGELGSICPKCYCITHEELADARTELSQARAQLKVAEHIVELAQYIGTAHSAYCATIRCNCVGHDKRRNDLAEAVADYIFNNQFLKRAEP